jgi:IS5 family transposase
VTVWLFRERLKELNLVEALFAKFHEQLAKRGYVARAGQMIDATFVEVPRQRNSREENAGIKAGAPPEAWKQQPTKRRQKDMDARWTKKNNETHYGYKNHINADEAHKLVQSYAVSDAAVHDSQVFEVLLDQTVDAQGKKRAAYADSAYRSKEREQTLAQEGFESHIHEKGTRGHPLTEEQKTSNRIKSKTRVRVEHVFGAQHAMGGHLVRTIGLARAKVKIGMMNLVYNMKRLGQLLKRDAQAAVVASTAQGRGASAVA